jgi:NAD(P)-dependent dehydrogenase (short-subunit alcohol dehydrogenase family)
MSEVRFDERVAIVTGAGGGLGRSHALLLASRGAKVVVNDLGGSVDGSGAGTSAADLVVSEIREAGGEAIANYDGVETLEGAEKIVQTAIDTYGRVDILINNAGILRDVTFHKMAPAQWDSVMAVHLQGTMAMSRVAWPLMREAGYGRIVNTTSAAGLYGNFGQANYAAAKMGIVGLSKTLAQEGAKYNIKTNVISPVAKSRMTESILPPPVLDQLRPEFVSAVVAHLASEAVEESGEIFAVGGGYVARVAVVESKGARMSPEEGLSPEQVRANWAAITDLSEAIPYRNAMEAAGASLGKS